MNHFVLLENFVKAPRYVRRRFRNPACKSLQWHFGPGDPLLEIVDLSLYGILEFLIAQAWNKPCRYAEGNFLLSFDGTPYRRSPEGLGCDLLRLYEHARMWAPGLDVPAFIPPVKILDSDPAAGYMELDSESYLSIAVAREFLPNSDAARLILAHEACHHFLLQSGISYQFKNNVLLNERVTDLTMFVCGFGEVVNKGHSVVCNSGGQGVNVHLGYLDSSEYKTAYQHVMSRRAAMQLPGIPEPVGFWGSLRHRLGGLLGSSKGGGSDGDLLEKVIQETERIANRAARRTTSTKSVRQLRVPKV